ncbi:MAG TPA: hypothetical protein VJL29_14975, partial [Thermoguttaceae bacterium]|nr:hypothetical protein [Thermoguttaceae bacterium]
NQTAPPEAPAEPAATTPAQPPVTPPATPPQTPPAAVQSTGTTTQPTPVAVTPPAGAAGSLPTTGQSVEDEEWATDADLGGTEQKAAVGMGRQGHGYGNDPVTYPLATYFRVRERIAIDQIKKAMQLYEALNGRYPRTQDEFRKEIIKANAITLARLPSGVKYRYDPKKAELTVIRAPENVP